MQLIKSKNKFKLKPPKTGQIGPKFSESYKFKKINVRKSLKKTGEITNSNQINWFRRTNDSFTVVSNALHDIEH
jgi:hypothetical protein